MAQDKDKPKESADDLIDWFTVSYRSIYIWVGVVLALAVGFGYWRWTSRLPTPVPVVETTPAPAQTSAGFAGLEGDVRVKKAGHLEWIPATKEMVLSRDDRVRTGSGAGAAIRLTNGTVFQMKADSLMNFEEGTVDPGSKRQAMTAAVQSGGVNFSTGSAAATIRGGDVSRTTTGQNTQGDVTVGQTGESVTKLFRGSATTETANGDRIELNPNEAVTVDATGKSSPKVALPGMPVLMAPPHQAEISYVNPAVSLTLLVWRGVPTAATYHVMVDYTQSFARPLVDQKWKPNAMELRGLEVGKYYWKVAAVDANGIEGSPSEVSLFSVTKPGPGQGADTPPSLNLETLEPKSNILHVKGRTEPGVSLTVNGQRVDVESDGSFNEFITLGKPGQQVVVIRATSIGGGVIEQKHPVVVTY